MTNPITAYIALGSNLNDPIKQITTAISHIKNIAHTSLDKCSAFYHTKPVGYLTQPDFINAVVSVNTTLSAHNLFDALQAIEKQQGRVRSFKNSPRIIDLDLLVFGDLIVNDPTLVIPHPQMTERAFVLKPLSDIAPTLILFDGKTVLAHLAKHPMADLIKVEMSYAES